MLARFCASLMLRWHEANAATFEKGLLVGLREPLCSMSALPGLPDFDTLVVIWSEKCHKETSAADIA